MAPGITWVLEPSVNGFLRSNIWHVRGRDRDLVVDTGMGISSLRSAYPDLFAGEVLAFFTHGHYDHTGGAHEFERRASHAAEMVMLSEPEDATLVTADLPQSFAAALAADEPGRRSARPSWSTRFRTPATTSAGTRSRLHLSPSRWLMGM